MSGAPDPALRLVFQFLRDAVPFRDHVKKPVVPPDNGAHFFATQDVKNALAQIADWLTNGTGDTPRVFGLRGNTGDGKTSLIRQVLRTHSSCLTVPIDRPDKDTTDTSELHADFAKALLYEMERREWITEGDYNTMITKFEGADDAALDSVTREALRKFTPRLKDKTVLFVADDVVSPECVAIFRKFLTLQDSRPPKPEFFAEIQSAILFTTSKLAVEQAWLTSLSSDDRLMFLRVRGEDMLAIVRHLLENAMKSTPGDWPDTLRALVAKARAENDVFPLNKVDFADFLTFKTQEHQVGDLRHDYDARIAEFQLRNTLKLLQTLIDAKALQASPQLVSLGELLLAKPRADS